MATEKQELETDARWKARYYEVLQELEGRQKEWQLAVQSLEGLASQLANVTGMPASGLSTALDEWQRENVAVDGTGELQSYIHGISQKLVELYQQTSSDNGLHPANVFVDILDKLQLPDTLEADFRQLKKNVRKLAWNDEGGEASALFMNIMQRLLHDDEELTQPTRKQKLISRLLARASQPEEAGDKASPDKQPVAPKMEQDVQQRFIAPAVGELLLQLALRMPDTVKRKINFATLKRHTNKARRRKDLLPIIDLIAQQIESAYQAEITVPVLLENDSIETIASAVAAFFEQVDLPVDLKPRLVDIEEKFTANKDDVDVLAHCLTALHEIVVEIGKRYATQSEELTHYLSQAVDQQRALENELQSASSRQAELADDDTALAEAIRHEITELRNSIENTENLQDSRTQILERLDSLQQQVTQLDRRANEGDADFTGLLGTLQRTLNEMEGASADLRNRLDEFRLQSLEDVLTGLPGRYACEKQLATEIARCRRYGSTLSLVVWRLDHLNDMVQSYGHAAGDRILQAIAGKLTESIRKTDFVARYGPDVFVTLMTETKLDDAVNVAAKLCEQIEQVPFLYHDVRVPLGVLVGIAELQPDETANSLFERADKAIRNTQTADTGSVNAAD